MSEDPTLELREAAASGVKAALAKGADAVEVFVSDVQTTTITAFGEAVSPHEGVQEGVAVRLLLDGRVGQSGSSGFHSLERAVEDAIAAARGGGPGGARLALAPGAREISPLDPDEVVSAGDADRLSGLVERISERLRRAPGVTYSRVSLVNARRRMAVANSSGLEIAQRSATESMEFEVRVSRGTTQRVAYDAWNGVLPVGAQRDLDAMADGAVAQARQALDHQPLPSNVDEIIMTGGPASQIVSIFASALSGVGVAAGKSPLAGHLGQPVVSEHLTLEDRPRAQGGRARKAFDDEGTPTKELVLVERGILKSFVHNRASAQAAGVEPTGHGMRQDMRSSVGARPINLSIRPGDASLEEIVEGARRAVLVTQPLMGAFVASRVTGDFSLVAPFAFYVENGRIRHALPPTTVGGNAHRFMESVLAVGSDPRNCKVGSVPTMRTEGVSCAT